MKTKSLSPVEAAKRGALVYAMRKTENLKFQEIAKRIGVSSSRARDIYEHHTWRLRRAKQWHNGLSSRVYHMLGRLGIDSKAEAKKMFPRFDPYRKTGNPRGYGWKAHVELARFLGFPEPQKRKPSVFVGKVCPHCHKPLV